MKEKYIVYVCCVPIEAIIFFAKVGLAIFAL